MANSLNAKQGNWISEHIALLLIAIVGLVLRLWQIGTKIFWMDELGVAQAAFQPTLSKTVDAAREHIMAMPLDYVTAWTMARISHTEGWLRLPEALWGFLTLLAGYKLCLELSGKKQLALFAMLMMALSPILIEYSQELRFYAPLTFFFTLALYLGLKAIRRSRSLDWLLFTLTTLIGLYFHFYLIMTLSITVLWLIPKFGKEQWERIRNYFGISAIILSIGFLIGLKMFGGIYVESQLSLFKYESLSSFLLTGLGWTMPFPTSPLGWVIGMLYMTLAIIGVVINLKRNPLGEVSLLFYGVILIVLLVIGLDALKNYPLFARQIIMLAPLLIFFSACGADWIVEKITIRYSAAIPYSWATTILFSLALILIASPALYEYYGASKGSDREIFTALSEHWQPQEKIHVEAGAFEVYSYYWSQDPSKNPLVSALTPLDYHSSDRWHYPDSAWFIVNYPPAKELEDALRSAGFEPAYIPQSNTLYPQMLWRRQ